MRSVAQEFKDDETHFFQGGGLVDDPTDAGSGVPGAALLDGGLPLVDKLYYNDLCELQGIIASKVYEISK